MASTFSFLVLLVAATVSGINSRHTQPDCFGISSSDGDAGDVHVSGVSVERGVTGFRLISGCNNRSGELQVKLYNQAWYSVCYESFDYFDAQFACNFLGFPFVESIYKISKPNISMGTKYTCTASDMTRGVTQLSQCTFFASQSPCNSYAGVVCDASHAPSEGFVAIVAYSYGAKFDIIAPDDGLFIENCNMGYGFCHGVYFANKNNSNFDTVISILSEPTNEDVIRYCGDHGNIAKFGVTCSPITGDPVLTMRDTSGTDIITTEGLVWYFDEMFEWINVCDNGLGYIEAQVLCNSIGFPYFSYLESAKQVLNPSHSKVIASIDCSGSEERLAECQIHLVNTSNVPCTQLSAVGCGGSLTESLNGLALIIFESTGAFNITASFTVISPRRGLYLTNCSATLSVGDHYCPGVHLIHENNTGLQSVYSAPGSCQGIQYGLFEKQCNPMTVHVTTVSQMDATGTDSSFAVPLAVGSILVAILCVAAGIGCLVGYRYCRLKRMDLARTKIMKDLEEHHSCKTMSFNGNTRIVKYHKPVNQRKSSTLQRRSNEDWEIPFECITMGEELGAGAYGTICKGVIDCCHQDEPVDVAVKLLKKYATESERRSLVQEIDLMKDIGYHRHVVSMLACCTKGQNIAMIMEFMPCGNLQMFLKKHRNSESEFNGAGSQAVPNPYILGGGSQILCAEDQNLISDYKKSNFTLTLTEQLQFARQITLGMEYLAGLKVVHRDLATRNVLIDEQMFLKVSDFGLSRDIYSDISYHMSHNKDKLPVRWMAIESIVDREFSTASDVWSFGVVLWEIVTCGSFPYYHMTNLEVINEVKNGYRLPKPEPCSDEMYDIMVSCWHKAPAQRPSFTELRDRLDALLDKGEYTSLM